MSPLLRIITLCISIIMSLLRIMTIITYYYVFEAGQLADVLHVSARARARLAGQKVSRPSAARAGTGTRLTSAVAHEWPSVSTVDGPGRPSPFHLQSSVPVSQIRRAGPVRLGPRPGSSPAGRFVRQWAVRCTCRDRDPAG